MKDDLKLNISLITILHQITEKKKINIKLTLLEHYYHYVELVREMEDLMGYNFVFMLLKIS